MTCKPPDEIGPDRPFVPPAIKPEPVTIYKTYVDDPVPREELYYRLPSTEQVFRIAASSLTSASEKEPEKEKDDHD